MNKFKEKMKIKKGDTVVVLLGKDRGKSGKVIKAFPSQDRVVVEGLNLVKKHVRARQSGQKGQRVTAPASLHVSNVQLVCPACKRGSRVRIKREGGSAERVCARCEGVIPVSKKE